jgi:hypothetical protein
MDRHYFEKVAIDPFPLSPGAIPCLIQFHDLTVKPYPLIKPASHLAARPKKKNDPARKGTRPPAAMKTYSQSIGSIRGDGAIR